VFNTIKQDGDGEKIRIGELFCERSKTDGPKISGSGVAAVTKWR